MGFPRVICQSRVLTTNHNGSCGLVSKWFVAPSKIIADKMTKLPIHMFLQNGIKHMCCKFTACFIIDPHVLLTTELPGRRLLIIELQNIHQFVEWMVSKSNFLSLRLRSDGRDIYLMQHSDQRSHAIYTNNDICAHWHDIYTSYSYRTLCGTYRNHE